jgi:ligand-binding SRPBCC domain-containing protein
LETRREVKISNVDSYLLRREQWIPQPIEDVFAFFADAGNLEAITPSWLDFQILSPRPMVMQRGAHIHYRLRWHGLTLQWLTEIESWNPPTEFVDVQARGPYRLWHHTHCFEPVDGGTRMRDVVRYALPFGPLGRLAHAWRVKSDLEAIFDYRALRVSEILGSRCAHE